MMSVLTSDAAVNQLAAALAVLHLAGEQHW